jgi:hypothetical protein
MDAFFREKCKMNLENAKRLVRVYGTDLDRLKKTFPNDDKIINSIDSLLNVKKILQIKDKEQLINLYNNIKSVDAKLGKEVTLNESIFGNSTLKINSFEIQDKFTIKYNYCPVNGDCYPSVEYIKPNLNTTFGKAIIKMDAELKVDSEYKIQGVASAFNVLEKFGTIVYIVNGKTYKIKGKLVNIPAKKKKVANHFYIEVNERILKSNYAYALIKVRNKEYKYIIKNIEEEK